MVKTSSKRIYHYLMWTAEQRKEYNKNYHQRLNVKLCRSLYRKTADHKEKTSIKRKTEESRSRHRACMKLREQEPERKRYKRKFYKQPVQISKKKERAQSEKQKAKKKEKMKLRRKDPTFKLKKKKRTRNSIKQKISRQKRQKERTKNDPKFKLRKRISHAIGHSLKGMKAGRHWEYLVSYTLEELKIHLESLWLSGMSWNNYNQKGWHIDHKIPESLWQYTKPEDSEFKQCWALANLQPLWAKDNLKKSNHVL